MITIHPAPIFNDNTRVESGRGYYEYLAVSLSPMEEDAPYKVRLNRYSVPGRIDTYAFYWHPSPGAGVGARLAYYSEGFNLPLDKALRLVEADLDRPNVVEMIVNGFRAERIVLEYQRDFLSLLNMIGPKTITYRRVKRLCEKTMEERQNRIKAL